MSDSADHEVADEQDRVYRESERGKSARKAMESTAVAPRPADPMALLQMLIEKGADADQLGKMTGLVERWAATRAKAEFNVAMNQCQADMPVVLHDKENTHTKSRYARLESVNKTCKPVLVRNGFSVSFGTEDTPLAEHVRIVATLRHIGGHTETFRGDIPLDGKGSQGGKSSMNAPQATGSTYSYGQRYMMKMIFNLTISDEDDDAQGVDPIVTPEQVGVINDLIEACADSGNPIDTKRFYAWLQVDGLHALTQSLFMKAVVELNRKRKVAKK